MKSAQLSTSAARRIAPATTAASTNQGADPPIAEVTVPEMKNAAAPSSVSVSAIVRHAGTSSPSAAAASTTGMRPICAAGVRGVAIDAL